MLFRKLGSLSKKNLNKYLSSLSLNNVENNVSVDMSSDVLLEKQNSVLKKPDYFHVHDLFTVKDLFNARVHFGHKESSLNDKMKPFIFGSRLGHIIFDLNTTAHHLREALNFAAHISYRDGVILFISQNPRVTLLVENTAKECKEYAVSRQWTIALFSNASKVFKYSVRLPDLCIIFNTLLESGRQHPAVIEAASMCIPTIGIVDSNCDPNLITYPVPGNDDSYESIALYCNLFKQAILRGKSERENHFSNQKVSDKISADNIKVINLLKPEEKQIKVEGQANDEQASTTN